MDIKVKKFIVNYFENLHQNRDIDWETFLAPFLYSFFSYYQPIKKEKNFDDCQEIIIPYGNNDFITSLEKETYHYELLVNRAINFNNTIKIAKPSNSYIDKYIFPYSKRSKIAFLSFPNKIEKMIYYGMSLFDIKSLKLDYLYKKETLQYSTHRDDLLKKLENSFGQNKLDMFKCLVFSIPSIYIEHFSFYYEKAKIEEKKVKDIKVIYFMRHVIFNPTFLMLLSLKSVKEKKLITYQHGGVYGQTVAGWSEKVEKILSTHFLTWGYKYDESDVPFISLRIDRKFFPITKKPSKKQAILLVLPLFFREEVIGAIKNSFKILSSADIKEQIYIRFDPREKNQKEIFLILDSLNIPYVVDQTERALVYVANDYETVVFTTPHATGYLELINLNITPFMIFYKKDFEIRNESLEIYQEMKKNNVWIDFDNVKSANLHKITAQQKKVINKFKNIFIKTSFFSAIRLNYLLLKYSFSIKNKDNS